MTASKLKRQVIVRASLLGATAATWFAEVEPRTAADIALTGGTVAGAWAWRWWRRRRFVRVYIDPTVAAMSDPLGNRPVKLHVDRRLGSLVARLSPAPSPFEVKVRDSYGRRVEPVILWPRDATMRAVWAAQRFVRPVTGPVVTALRRPGEKPGPRIELHVDAPFLTVEQRTMMSAIVHAKIPVSDLVESWDQVGETVTARWTVRKRPPSRVGSDRLVASLPRLAEWEFYLGDGPGGDGVTVSLHDDSPHMAVSAGSGAGKSILAQLIAVQVLARGGRVTILDRKGSHRWALGLEGVDYCTRPEQMHAALIAAAQLADERNTLALHEDDDWDPGHRVLVICEELNATIGQLAAFWTAVREKDEPKRSPAIGALADLLFMGRSAKVNVIAIAQMLTARAIGGPEARENFGVRFLARFTANNWKMLVPEAAMPRPSRTLGRWQMVVGGVATEIQVCYLTRTQARMLAMPAPERGADPDRASSSNVPEGQGQVAVLTLPEACAEGVLPWSYEATKKRLQRRIGTVPRPVGNRANADLYRRTDLVAWAASVQESQEA